MNLQSPLTPKTPHDCVQYVVTTRVDFLYQILLGIASYTEQNLAIRSRLYGVEYFCYSEQIIRGGIFLQFRLDMWSRTFLLLRTPFLTEHLWWLLAIPSRLYRVEHFCNSEQVIYPKIFAIPCRLYIVLCYSEQVILSTRSLLFQVIVDYTKNVYNEQKFSAILFSLNQSEHFEDPKKVSYTEQKFSSILPFRINFSEDIICRLIVILSKHLLSCFHVSP